MTLSLNKGGIIMIDNIIFEKIWQDGNIVELKIKAISEFVKAYQNCYVEDSFLKGIPEQFSKYINTPNRELYIEFGNKTGNYTPAFSMRFLPLDKLGHTKIEVDIEIADNNMRAHRCCFYVMGELGSIERLGKSLSKIADGIIGEICSLNYID